MGMLDSLVSGALRSVLSDGNSSQLPGVLSEILGKTDLGSLGGLLSQLQQGGLGQEVSSWLSNGQNMPASPDQLRQALGNEQLQQLARSLGLPVDALLAMLSQHLPGAIDQMSPNGHLDERSMPADSGPARNTNVGDTSNDGASSDSSLGDQAGVNDIRI